LETQTGRPTAARYHSMRAIQLVVALATAASIVLLPLQHPAGASSVSSLQQRANQLSEQLVQAQLEVDGYQQQYSVATERVSADQKAIAGIQAKIASDKTQIIESTHAVRQLALLTYVYNDGESASSEAGLFSENVKTAQAANEYVNISVGDLDEAVANLHRP
jgi:hypothetical protein